MAEDDAPPTEPDASEEEPPEGWYLSEVVPATLAGERLDRAVALLADCSRAEAAAVVSSGEVLVDGRAATRASHRLVAGEVLTVRVDPHRAPVPLEPEPDVAISVVHQDDDVIVVDKPPGLVVHPGPGHRRSTLVHGLLARFPELAPPDGPVVGQPDRPGIVHRLDRDTSGLMVVARNPSSYRWLVEQLSHHAVERVYVALVWRHPEHDRGVIDAPIGRSRRDPLRMTVTVEGRPARTRFVVDRRFTDPVEVALLTCRLETGRTHQIRVHLSSVGHPVVGDPIYGGRRASFPVDRPFLHARHLAFVHPRSGERVSFDSPLPGDLTEVLDRLR